VHDLGRDVPAEKFVETATRENADLICLSSLMTTAAIGMGDVVSNLKKQGVRNNFKVLIGGACVSQAYAQKIGADAYASNAAAAVKVSKELLGIN
jgi:methanogenic corrinoid protein MtbC1